MEEKKGFILVIMTSQLSKGAYLLHFKLVQHLEYNASTALTVLLSICSKRGCKHVVLNVK